MAAYTFLYRLETIEYSKVSDEELNKVFQDVRKLMVGLFISEIVIETKMWLMGSKKETLYNIYHLVGTEVSDVSEVRCLNVFPYTEELVHVYLCGLFNGYNYRVSRNYPSLN